MYICIALPNQQPPPKRPHGALCACSTYPVEWVVTKHNIPAYSCRIHVPHSSYTHMYDVHIIVPAYLTCEGEHGLYSSTRAFAHRACLTTSSSFSLLCISVLVFPRSLVCSLVKPTECAENQLNHVWPTVCIHITHML